jgi:hypothetical protein
MTSGNDQNNDRKEFLQNSLSIEQKLLKVKLELSSKSITHAGTIGAVNEEHFLNVLRKYLPNRYAVDSGIIIDSTGSTSHQIDVVIYDKQYTPTLLDQKNHRYIPSEAIYAVFEVKPTINKQYLDYAGEKAESVRVLHRTSIPIVHAGGEYKPKTLFPIVAGIVASNIEWTDGFSGTTFQSNHSSLIGSKVLDCGLAVSGDCFDIFDGAIRIGPSENAMAYFLFRLLQKLQSLGTVPAIDWNAYAEVLGK